MITNKTQTMFFFLHSEKRKAKHQTVLHTDALCQISGSWPLWFPRKMWQKLSCEQICLCPQYSKWRHTGSGHAADSEMRYTIQFSVLMLCAKYQEAGLCGSWEKCDRNYLVSKFAFPQYSKLRKTGTGHAADSKLRYTIQFSILMLCDKYQEAGLCGSWEKCDRNFLWRRRRKTTEVIPRCRLR